MIPFHEEYNTKCLKAKARICVDKIKYLLFMLCFLLAANSSLAQDMSKYSYPELDSLMMLNYQKGSYLNAIAYMAEGRKRAKNDFGSLDSIYAEYTANLGLFYDMTAQYQQAEKLYLEVLSIDKANKENETANYGNLLNNLAALYRRMGKYEAVEPILLEAMEVFKKVYGPKHPSYAQSLNSLALLYSKLGKLNAAEPFFLQAISISKKASGNENTEYASFLNNLGGLYRRMRRFNEAEKLFFESNAINKKVYGDKHPIYAQSLNNIAALYINTKKYVDAEPLLLEAMSIYKDVLGPLHPDYAQSLNNLGALYVNMRKFETAKTYILEAVEIDKKTLGTKHSEYVLTLNNLASLYSRMLDIDQAIETSNRAIVSICKTCDSSILADLTKLPEYEFYSMSEITTVLGTRQEIIQIQHRLKKDEAYLKEAYALLQAAMKLNEKTRNGFNGDEDKLRTLRQMSQLVIKAIQTGIHLTKGSDKTYIQNSFSYAEQNKSVLLADAIKGSKARVMGDLPESLALRELDLIQQKKKLKKAEIEARKSNDQYAVQTKMNKLNLEISAFLSKLKEQYPKYHALKYENITAKAEDIQALLDDKSLLLEFFVADTVTYLFVVSKKEVELYPINIKKKVLKKEIRSLRKALSNYSFIVKQEEEAYQLFANKAEMFYNVLLREALQGKDADNLIIVTDGELGHIPFEVFLVEPAPQTTRNYKELHYLINDYNISYNYSATLWKENLQATHETNNAQLLACAAAYPKIDSLELYKQRPFHMAQLRDNLDPLPAAQEEIKALSESFQGSFLQKNETNEAYFKQNAHKYGVIHLAMHGILNAREPILSALAFTENQDSLEDNFLHVYEIAHLHLNADLVVLSACETGFGKFEQGEGVISLARSFMYAGTPSLVVSLWQVNDHSTAVIMQAFYENLSQGMYKDAALRQAKLDYLKKSSKIATHPAFWSAFIQLGDSRPIVLKRRGGWLPWAIGGGVVVLLALFMFRRRAGGRLSET